MGFDKLIELIFAVNETEFSEFEYENKEEKIRIRKGEKESAEAIHVVSTEEAKSAPETPKICVEDGYLVKSPMVGIFYGIEGIEMGKRVEKGQILGNIEAMKLMNEITSEQDGVIEEIFVKDGQAVEFGQPMFLIK